MDPGLGSRRAPRPSPGIPPAQSWQPWAQMRSSASGKRMTRRSRPSKVGRAIRPSRGVPTASGSLQGGAITRSCSQRAMAPAARRSSPATRSGSWHGLPTPGGWRSSTRGMRSSCGSPAVEKPWSSRDAPTWSEPWPGALMAGAGLGRLRWHAPVLGPERPTRPGGPARHPDPQPGLEPPRQPDRLWFDGTHGRAPGRRQLAPRRL